LEALHANNTSRAGQKSSLREFLTTSFIHSKENDKVRAALELVQSVVSEEQWTVLCAGETPAVKLAAAEVENACMRKMRELHHQYRTSSQRIQDKKQKTQSCGANVSG
jgi:hypothetical protein